jgi:predicted kinase
MKIIITTGCTASGKSTWAKEFIKENPSFVRFSRDDVRSMLNGGNPWVHFKSGDKTLINSVENTVTAVQKAFIVSNLKHNRDIIIDETNVKSRTFNDVCRLLDNLDFYVIVEEKAFYVDLEEALRRDRQRDPKVGDDVVNDFWHRLGGEKFKNYTCKTKEFFLLPVLTLNGKIEETDSYFGTRGVIICDLDGTLALFGDKNPFDRDFENDDVNYPLLNVIQNSPYDIIFVSGRTEKHRDKTELFLIRNLGHTNYRLFMREDGDSRNDAIVKYEIYRDKIHNKYIVVNVFDDRNRVVNMWRKQGLPCFQVADGDF